MKKLTALFLALIMMMSVAMIAHAEPAVYTVEFDSLTEWDFAGRERFRHVLRAGLPLIWCIVGAVFSLLWIAGDRWVDKMPGDFFRDAGKLIQNGEFYFYRRVPYSAYFYFGDRTIPHADEDAPTSEAASQGYFLVSRKRDIRRHPLKYPRRLLLETGVWALYAPVEGTGNAGTAAEPPTE